MLRPAISEMLGEKQDVYSFVVAVAKRARAIAVKAEEEGEILEGKPVKITVDEYANRKSHIVKSEF